MVQRRSVSSSRIVLSEHSASGRRLRIPGDAFAVVDPGKGEEVMREDFDLLRLGCAQ
jgi:hypothetical protein